MTNKNQNMAIPLHDYQIYCKNRLLHQACFGLFLKPGLGKTSIVLEALYELNPTNHVLVIAPLPIARCTWPEEIEKWELPFRWKSLIVNEKGKKLTAKKREEIYEAIPNEPPTIYFINQELVASLTKRFPKENWPFRIVIIDESQSFKNYKAIRFKQLQSVRPYIQRMILMTGSPDPNGLMDLWSQIWLLDMGQRLGKNITTYRETYFLPGLIANGYPVTWRLRDGSDTIIYNKIQDIVISMKNDFLKLPDLTFHDAIVKMDDTSYTKYKKLVKTNVLALNDDCVVEASNAAVLQGKLSQMASGALYTDTDHHEFIKLHECKLEMCEYLIRNTDDNILLAYYFQSDLVMLKEYFDHTDIPYEVFDGTPEMLAKWNARQIKVLLIQPASYSRGLNFQKGGATLIWYTLQWSLEIYEQTNARIYRQGQQQPCIIHHIITKDTVDEKILKALKQKDITQNALIEAVKVVIDKISK